VLRPVRRAFNRLRARVEQPAALLYNPNVTASDIRLLVSIARKRGDRAAEVAALLRMVQRAVANETEQRAVRRVGIAAPAPAATGAEAAVAPGGAEIQLTLRRPGPTGPFEVTIGDQSTPSNYWRSTWADLPDALTDQLTTGVLTRLAASQGVTAVQAGDPASVPVARAVAAGIGARYGEQL
jgi:hypothetical protein